MASSRSLPNTPERTNTMERIRRFLKRSCCCCCDGCCQAYQDRNSNDSEQEPFNARRCSFTRQNSSLASPFRGHLVPRSTIVYEATEEGKAYVQNVIEELAKVELESDKKKTPMKAESPVEEIPAKTPSEDDSSDSSNSLIPDPNYVPPIFDFCKKRTGKAPQESTATNPTLCITNEDGEEVIKVVISEDGHENTDGGIQSPKSQEDMPQATKNRAPSPTTHLRIPIMDIFSSLSRSVSMTLMQTSANGIRVLAGNPGTVDQAMQRSDGDVPSTSSSSPSTPHSAARPSSHRTARPSSHRKPHFMYESHENMATTSPSSSTSTTTTSVVRRSFNRQPHVESDENGASAIPTPSASKSTSSDEKKSFYRQPGKLKRCTKTYYRTARPSNKEEPF